MQAHMESVALSSPLYLAGVGGDVVKLPRVTPPNASYDAFIRSLQSRQGTDHPIRVTGDQRA